jgi:hypothetical protein
VLVPDSTTECIYGFPFPHMQQKRVSLSTHQRASCSLHVNKIYFSLLGEHIELVNSFIIEG